MEVEAGGRWVLREASFVVVTVPSAETALRIAQYMRIAAHDACRLVRARLQRSLVDLEAARAHVVVVEGHEDGCQIALASRGARCAASGPSCAATHGRVVAGGAEVASTMASQ